MKKTLIVIMTGACLFSPLSMNNVYADAVAGDTIVTLGEDLTVVQKNNVLDSLSVDEDDVDIVYVSNSEEHKYLGQYIPASQIGSKAISSAKIEIGEEGSGIVVDTDNISYITPEMYTNALATAGVTDSKITVTAPFKVSGTGALTGIIKAYEETTGNKISEKQKQVANEEMVLTSNLASDDTISDEDAVDFVKKVKEEISKSDASSDEDIRDIINRVADELGMNLSDAQIEKFIEFFKSVKDLNIDWSKVNDTISAAKEKWNELANDESTKGVISSFQDFCSELWNWVTSIFSTKK